MYYCRLCTIVDYVLLSNVFMLREIFEIPYDMLQSKRLKADSVPIVDATFIYSFSSSMMTPHLCCSLPYMIFLSQVLITAA